jgi:hypothetical protein
MKPFKENHLRQPTKGAALGSAWRPIDATKESDPGPPPEAIFDRATGPLPNRSTSAGNEP